MVYGTPWMSVHCFLEQISTTFGHFDMHVPKLLGFYNSDIAFPLFIIRLEYGGSICRVVCRKVIRDNNTYANIDMVCAFLENDVDMLSHVGIAPRSPMDKYLTQFH